MKNRTGNIPRQVYKQCIWIMRDRDRLLDLVAFFEENCECFENESQGDVVILTMENNEGVLLEAVVNEAKSKLAAIKRAEMIVPDSYRKGLINSISKGEAFPDYASENTWKKWKKIFIEQLAIELYLI